jgi:hypothetical protein
MTARTRDLMTGAKCRPVPDRLKCAPRSWINLLNACRSSDQIGRCAFTPNDLEYSLHDYMPGVRIRPNRGP